MKKIETLTPEQEKKIPEYVAKWVAKGLTTTQRTLEDAQIDFSIFQEKILQKKKIAPVVLLKSPSKCWEAVVKSVDPTVDPKSVKFVYPYFDCQFWAGFFGFYDFMKYELGIEYPNLTLLGSTVGSTDLNFMKYELGIEYPNDEQYEALKRCQGYGMVFPLDNLCVVCQPPTVIKKKNFINGVYIPTNGTNNELHCTDGPALSYDGDDEIYALNGVKMKKEYVMEKDISADVILRETNVEIRRELIRKVGIEKMLNSLPHKMLDKRDTYELYSIELSEEVKDARYLKMTNPSIGVFHLEGVDPSISTVSDALKWRNNNMFENADVLT